MVAAARAGAPNPRLDEGVLPPEIARAAEEARDLPLGERMRRISEPLLGRAYRVDAAGEGRAPDDDPPARYDAFDCLTFVEEVMALAIAADPRSAPLIRNHIRYQGGQPAYEQRNHFMLSQWIPHNVAAGRVKDITPELGVVRWIEKDITLQTWSGWRKRSRFLLQDEHLPVGRFRMPVLPLATAKAVAADIPTGALVLTVRQDRPGVPIVVTHLGFAVPGVNGPSMRHATKMGKQVVRDHTLAWYLDHVRTYDKWLVEGITVLMPQEMGPRVSRLPRPETALDGALLVRSAGGAPPSDVTAP